MVEITIVINAIFSVLLIGTFVGLGLLMIYKYIKYKKIQLLFMGLTWIGLSGSWISSSTTVLMVVADPTSPGLSLDWYIILATFLIPFTTPLYTIAMTDLVLQDHKKLIRGITIGYSAFYEIFLFAVVLTGNVGWLVERELPELVHTTILEIILLLPFMISFLFLGYVFCLQAFKTEDPEIKLKGRILIVSYTMFIFGNFLEEIQIVALQRIILMIAAIGFYVGYMLPDWAKRVFLRKV